MNEYESLFEEAPCGYLSLRPTGIIARANETVLRWLDYGRDDLVERRRIQDLLGAGDRIFFETHLAPLLRMQHFANEISLVLRKRDGTKLSVLASATELRNAEGTPVETRLCLMTIVDRKRYEDELRAERNKADQALRDKSDFVSLLTHEIRTPLNAIIGSSHLLADTQLTDEQTTYSDMLTSSSETLMLLLNSILDFSKINSERAHVEQRSFNFERSIRATALGLQGRAIQKGIQLVVEIAPEIPELLLGDPVKIGQIVTNLIGNAIKFTSVGSVTLRVEVTHIAPDYSDLRVSVIDTGIGIAQDVIPKIFDEYAQANFETGATYGGTGLGLAIVQRLVRLHGSHVHVESAIGLGTTFKFDLRLRRATGPQAAERKKPIFDDRLRGLRILVADDSEDNQTILQLLMSRWGVEVIPALDGREVLKLLGETAFDLILMDLRMPIMDGYETVAAIRNLTDAATARIPIIAFSASATLDDQEIVSADQFQDVLGKPYKPADLFQKIAKLVR